MMKWHRHSGIEVVHNPRLALDGRFFMKLRSFARTSQNISIIKRIMNLPSHYLCVDRQLLIDITLSYLPSAWFGWSNIFANERT